jgi:uncharacterized GH25 family protein
LSRPRLRRALAASALALAPLSPAAAHDFWLQPTRWEAEVGQMVGLQLLVGEPGAWEFLPRAADSIERFEVQLPGPAVGDALARPIPGVEGRVPAGLLRVGERGLHLVGYVGRPTAVELDPEKFEAYLAEEGLDWVAAQRRARGEAHLPGRETFSRCAKLLLRTPEGGSSGFDRRLGLPLELVPLDDPFQLAAGEPLRLLALRDGAPVHDLRLDLQRLGPERDVQLHGRTDAAGLWRVELPPAVSWDGSWLFSGVQMERAAEGSGADWSSRWASLTLARPVPAEERAVSAGSPSPAGAPGATPPLRRAPPG